MAFLAKADNAKSLITNNPLLSGGLSITLTTGTGSKFPATGQFVVTLWDNTTYSDPGDDPTMEKILIDSVSGDTLTVNASGRGYDGTSAVSHTLGTRIALLNIKKHFTDIEAGLTNGAGNQSTGIDTDGTLAANSDVKIPSQKAVKTYVDTNAPGSGWIASEAATYVSQDGSTGVFNIASDVTGKYSPGMRYKYQQSQPLTAYWNFDANSTSQVGSFNGTDTNMSYTAGKFENAATFNGTTSKIVIADNAALKPTGEFTIGCWFKTASTGSYKVLFQSISVNTNIAGLRLEITSNNVLDVFLGNNTGTAAGINYSLITGNTVVTDNNYHYVVISFRNNYLQIYLDGKLETSGYCLTPAYAATNYVRVGCANSSGSDSSFMNGQIDDLFLINGYALDEKTIKAQYDAQAAQGTGNITVQKYGLITAVGAYSGGNTPITIWGGTDYSIQNATISSPYYATVKSPFGFPIRRMKWTKHFSNAVDQNTSANLATTWYNPGGFSLDIPIGNWAVYYLGNARAIDAGSNTSIAVFSTLSTSSSSESDIFFRNGNTFGDGTANTKIISFPLSAEKEISLTAKTTYYLLIQCNRTTSSMGYYGSTYQPTIIRAVSTLL